MLDIFAYVSFNGTGTPAIYYSKNISALSDNGVGDFGLYFITRAPHKRYGGLACGLINGALTRPLLVWEGSPVNQQDVFFVYCLNVAASHNDPQEVTAFITGA